MEESKIIRDKVIARINPETGLSFDYSGSIAGFVLSFDNGIDFVKGLCKKYPFHMKTYEEFFFGFKNLVVDDKNRESIKRIDELSAELNEIFKDPDSIDENTRDAFISKYNEIVSLIKGDNSLEV